MWFSSRTPLLLLCSLIGMSRPTAAEQMLTSSSLNTCQDNSGFTASLFDVTYTPHNATAFIDIVAVSSIQGNVVFDVAITAYGYQIIRQEVNPCNIGLAGLCPMTAGKIPLTFNLDVGKEASAKIPGIAYTFPDLDAKVKVFINMTSGDQAGTSVACVEADISNGKTVNLIGVKWATAIVAGLALASSAVISGLGHSNAASHVAANALSLFGYFQAQAMIGMTSVPLPPIVQSWTQDFQWSMGIIHVDFMQDIFTWYQRATGGTPSTLFDSLSTVSVQVEKKKRSLDVGLEAGMDLFKRGASMMPRAVAQMPRAITKRAAGIMKRGNIMNSSGSYVVYGIQRVAYKAGIESTNLFMTGLTFFCVFVVFTIMGVAAFKGFCEVAVKHRWMKSDKFVEFRNGWFTVLKGILFRLTLIGFPQMTILCLWEFTQKDSAAEVVLAVFFFFGMLATLAWASSKVIRIARRSVVMHRNPAYILFSDPQALNKWGFLYVQFRASAYYFIVPTLGYLLIKSVFLAFSQGSGTAQAIAFIILEAGTLVGASVLRPWMDKSTNSFNISICVINFLNSVFLLVFTDVFDQPAIVTGVVGVILWITNAVFALVLLLMLIVTTGVVLIRRNPDARYQFMADDRASFMKSQTQLNTTTELDALAATARGDKHGYKAGFDMDEDNESISSDSMKRRTDPSHMQVPQSANSPLAQSAYREPPRSPVDPSVPLFPADGRRGTGNSPPDYGGYNNSGGQFLRQQPSGSSNGGSAYNGSSTNLTAYRGQNNASPANAAYGGQSTASPWQRGAGYEH
ncbi:Flavin carrier protein 2 [Cytospora mali]|uniref:Flavin carrier protein 2 n=1 Tax=Cytospora mali TaxID=578113 RepID=A0A194VBS8_CYTMA|nr:Flavin carrier protein 2 [Valsa mali var. pyri (nom. inval.)]